MKLQTKKIIAREFLILIVTVIITSISFVLIYPYNSYRQNQLDKLTDTIYSKTKLADSLANSYNMWSIQQQKDPLKDLYDEFNSQLNLAKNYDEFKQVMSDQKNRQVFFNEFNPKINLAKSFDEFDEALGFKKGNQSQDDPFTKYGGKAIAVDNNDPFAKYGGKIISTSSNKIYNEIDSLNKSKEYIHSKIFSSQEQIHFATITFIIFLSLLFIVRYIFLGIKWSIKTLQQNTQ